ncbi:1-acylglycerol-3-phosphate O-acyltransferase [Propionibacterium freudenreichii]|nr:1-acylglycerol-3-phosphate O-acyltransferase [Propionibacterium freudenreichii]
MMTRMFAMSDTDRPDAPAVRDAPNHPQLPESRPPTLRGSLRAAARAAGFTRGLFRGTREALTAHVEGVENIPEGAAILACNHRLPSDFTRLEASVERPVRLVDLNPDVRGRGKRARAIPLEGAAPGHPDAVSVLGEGGLVVVFPEGDPSPDGRLHRGNPEVAWLALATQVPVVPVGIELPEREGMGGRTLSRMLGPTIAFGKPLDFSRYWTSPALSDALDGVLLRGCTAEIMAAIGELSGQLYQDDTPAQAKELIRQRRHREAEERADNYPTLWEQRRQAAIEREQLRVEDQRDLERAAAEAARNARRYADGGAGERPRR